VESRRVGHQGIVQTLAFEDDLHGLRGGAALEVDGHPLPRRLAVVDDLHAGLPGETVENVGKGGRGRGDVDSLLHDPNHDFGPRHRRREHESNEHPATHDLSVRLYWSF